MTDIRDSTPRWRISTRSAGGNCVQVQIRTSDVRIRHSFDRSGPVLTFATAAFRDFLDGVRNGEFDRPE
jgi:hypothetical protein